MKHKYSEELIDEILDVNQVELAEWIWRILIHLYIYIKYIQNDEDLSHSLLKQIKANDFSTKILVYIDSNQN